MEEVEGGDTSQRKGWRFFLSDFGIFFGGYKTAANRVGLVGLAVELGEGVEGALRRVFVSFIVLVFCVCLSSDPSNLESLATMSEPEVKKAKVDENAEVTDVAVEAAENAAPGEEVDAALEAIAEEPPSTSGWKDHKMNIAEAVTIDVEGDSFGNIAEAPITVLQGLGPKAEEIMTALGLKSVKELAENKFFKIARAIVVLEALEKEDKRPAKSIMNIDTAVRIASCRSLALHDWTVLFPKLELITRFVSLGNIRSFRSTKQRPWGRSAPLQYRRCKD